MKAFRTYFYVIASLFLSGYFIYITQAFFKPLLAGLILAFALKPLVSGLEYLKIPRLLSTLMVISFFILLVLSLIFIFLIQVSNLQFEMDSVQQKSNQLFNQIKHSLWEIFGLSSSEQNTIWTKSYSNVLENSTSIFTNTLSFTTGFVISVLLFIISLFFFLYYRAYFVSFLNKILRQKYHHRLESILKNVQSVIYHYIIGLSLVILTVAILNSIGLLLLGIKNAIFFGMSAAFLTLIPYIGITIAALITVFFVFLSHQSLWYCVGVLAVFLIVQAIEGNFLTPKIVGRQVRINPFAAILTLVLGGMFMGIVGVILALPLLAILKVIFDEIPGMQPVAYLLEIPNQNNIKKSEGT
ncbi:AI-2E family transporter [Legionella impletisoli]|uniref:AI-2E family transporter n=1 Tax=Legionella impletisoli TaxID=343510 RepID=UPI00104110A2|nr:AI-2E family transporter [Legionella impletisoli]